MARKTGNEAEIAYLEKKIAKVTAKIRKHSARYDEVTTPLCAQRARLQASIDVLREDPSEEVTKVNGTVEVASER